MRTCVGFAPFLKRQPHLHLIPSAFPNTPVPYFANCNFRLAVGVFI